MRVFISYSSRDRDLARAVVDQLRRQGDEAIAPLLYEPGGDVLSKIFSEMRSADLVLALLAGRNPNVYYELGVAVGAGIPVLVVSATGDPAPADVAALPFVQSTGNIEADVQKIVLALSRFRPSTPRRPEKFESVETALHTAAKDSAYLEALAPERFEELIREWFRTRRCIVEEHTGGADRGYDFSIRHNESVYLVEIRKMTRQTRVSIDAVRALVGAVHFWQANGGVLISTSGYTSAAIALAGSTPVVLRILEDLLSARSLFDLWGDPAANTALQQTERFAPRS